MLLDDRERMVKLYIDNLLWGNLTFVQEKLRHEWNDNEDENNLQLMTARWTRQYCDKPNSNEFKDLTNLLSGKFIAARIFGSIIGEMRDRDNESRIKELEADNKKFAEQLSQSYIPPKDPKVGTS